MRLVRLFLAFGVLLVFGWSSGAGATPYYDVVMADNPVSYWRLGDSGSLGVDEVGGRDLSYEGSPNPGQSGAIADDPNSATGFSGDRSALSVAADAGLQSQTFSIEAWAKITGSCESQSECVQRVISQRGTSAGYTLDYGDNNQNWLVGLRQGSQNTVVEGSPTGLNQWSHLVGTYDGTVLSLFVDGSLVGSAPASFSPGSVPFTIGRNISGDPRYPLDGVVDEVAYYNYALSADRVSAHYQTGIGVIPEPSTALLLGLGLAGMTARRKSR